jgi:type III secretory pathway component EscS
MENHKIHTTPKDFFLYVGAMVALYVSAFSLLSLLFAYINVLLPDNLEFYRVDFSSGAIRFSIASLIIIFPVYLVLTKILNKDVRKNPEKKSLWIRKWLIYFTLFVSGITIIVELIRLIDQFLGGDLSTQFVLKIVAVLVVTGGVFGYYIYDIKGKWEREASKAKMVGWITAFIILIAVVSGFFIIGSPTSQRLARFDQQKVNDLQNIQWQVVNFWQNKKRLPENLSELEDPISSFMVPVDQQTQEEYGYKTTSVLTFELCAEFNKESTEQSNASLRVAKPFGGPGIVDSNWAHEEGEICFERTIDPDLYKLRNGEI